ncbi:MAG: hypothetical protein U0Q55_12910 [Vicinamibacterales bacterium]
MPPERTVVMQMRRFVAAAGVVGLCAASPAAGQGFGASASKPRPWSRVSFFVNSSRTSVDGSANRDFTELTTAFSYQLPELDDSGADYGIDARYSAFSQEGRPARTSIYEGFVGLRTLGGRLRARAGHLWLTDVGALGSIAGAAAEYRQGRATPEAGRLRAGAFAGLEPNILDLGYAESVTKYGAYVAYDGAGAQRHSLGYVSIRHGALTERAVVTTTNFLPVRRKFFLYQAAEVNVTAPAGVGRSGLAYFFANARLTPTERVELQGTYNRGRSIDARGLGDDVLTGRPIPQRSIDGLLYESAGGRVTLEVVSRVRVYGGVSLDKNNRDTERTRRILVGGYASNIGGSGWDLTASDSIMQRDSGSYESRYVSLGRQLGRRTYVSADYSTSLSVIRYSRLDGLVIETRPRTTRYSGTFTATLDRSWSLLGVVDYTRETGLRDTRVLTGLTYRIR